MIFASHRQVVVQTVKGRGFNSHSVHPFARCKSARQCYVAIASHAAWLFPFFAQCLHTVLGATDGPRQMLLATVDWSCTPHTTSGKSSTRQIYGMEELFSTAGDAAIQLSSPSATSNYSGQSWTVSSYIRHTVRKQDQANSFYTSICRISVDALYVETVTFSPSQLVIAVLGLI